MKAVLAILLCILIFSAGYFIGRIKTYPEANVAGRHFGFGLGKIYYKDGDAFDRKMIEVLFPEDLEYIAEQEEILKDKLKHGGLRFYRADDDQ